MKDLKDFEGKSVECKSLKVTAEDKQDKVNRSDPESVFKGVGGPPKEGECSIANFNEGLCKGDEVAPKILTQVVCSLVVASAHLGIGAVNGFSGVTLPQLTQPDNGDLYLSPSNAAFFGSVTSLGIATGGLISGPISAKIGHCKTMLLSLPVSLAFWLLLAFSWNPASIILSRAVLGITSGVIYTTSLSYTLEVTHKKHRGILFSITPVARHTGSLVVYSFGVTSLTWRQMALICGIATTIPAFFGLILFPESPRWLLTLGKEEGALKAMLFFRGKAYDSASELKDIRDQLDTDRDISKRNQLRQLFQKPIRNMFLMLLFLSFISNFNGSFAITTYLVPIFQVVSTNIDAYICAILVGAVRVIGTLINLLIIERLGRRPVHLSTYLVMSLTIAIMGSYFYVQDSQWVVDHLSWVPLTSLLIYTLFMGIGQPVLIMIFGELLPTSVRAIGVSMLVSVCFFGSFFVTQMFYVMEESIGIHGTFWTYGGVSMFVFILSVIYMPETRGLSLEEIAGKK